MNSANLKSVIRNTGRALAASVAFSVVSAAESKPFSKIVTFGDSLSDTGNAFRYTGGCYPATPQNAPGRICNGKIWVQHLMDSLGMKLKPDNQCVMASHGAQDQFVTLR